MVAVAHSSSIEERVWRKLNKRLLVNNPDYRGPSFECDPGLLKAQAFRPTDFSDAHSAACYYGVSSFLKKWKGFDIYDDAFIERATFAGWLASEKQCGETNRRLESECCEGLTPFAFGVIERAQRKIAQILGRCDVDSVLLKSRFSNGATYDTRYGTRLDEKISFTDKAITKDAIPLWERFLELVPGVAWQFSGELRIVRCDRLVLVPKDAFIGRGINPMPLLNGFLGQGVGRTIRERLRAHGVDLNDQTINQKLAFHCQVDGLSTIDMSSASDTMSKGIVKLLLAQSDPGWYELLTRLRVTHTSLGPKDVYLNKFSAMGCPFTFELESLIFYALARSICGDDSVVSVYGDDVIVPSCFYDDVVKALNWAGFTINGNKSYTYPSRFYESCGRHYFDLEDITPLYQKDVCRNVPDLVRLHNRIVRFGVRTGLLSRVWSICCDVRKHIAQKYKIEVDYGPCVEHDQWLLNPAIQPSERAVSMRVVVQKHGRLIKHGNLSEVALCAYKVFDGSYSNIREDGRVELREREPTYVVRQRRISPLKQLPAGSASGWLP